ncbi:outer dynein arm-docking complex subunit 1 [Halyomorpha halys]|uniref:outer dynein arm-docking complex subunit 1 n=1 Tax=Halyomorpha halys TaxID=286706 RepID=UPI0034D22FEE
MRRGFDATPHLVYLWDRVTLSLNGLSSIEGAFWGLRYPDTMNIYKGVVLGILRYASLVWSRILTQEQKKRLASMQRLALLNVTKAYKTVSHEAVQVLAGAILLDLILKDDAAKYDVMRQRLGVLPEETVGLNKLMTKNRHMREEMKSLLRERERFKGQLDELLSRLSAGRAFIHDLMEQGTVAFEHREEAQGKLLLLRRKRVVLQEKHGQAMRDLERELEDNIRSAIFMTKKGEERGGNAVRAEEEEGKRKLVQGEVRRLEKALEKILDYFPDISDPNAMADQYMVQEDENFAIFNYVNEVNCEASLSCTFLYVYLTDCVCAVCHFLKIKIELLKI